MDSLCASIKSALEQAAEYRKTLEDVNQESERLAENYRDILQERQALREANRALMSTILLLRGHIQDLEVRLLGLDSSSCSYYRSSSTTNYLDCLGREDDDTRQFEISNSQQDGKDLEEVEKNNEQLSGHGQRLGRLTWIEAKDFEKSVARNWNSLSVRKTSNIRSRSCLPWSARSPVTLLKEIKTSATSNAQTVIAALQEIMPDGGVYSCASFAKKELAFDTKNPWPSSTRSGSGWSAALTKQYSNYTPDTRCSNRNDLVDRPKRQMGQPSPTSSEEEVSLREAD